MSAWRLEPGAFPPSCGSGTGSKPDRNTWEQFTSSVVHGLLERFFTLGGDGNFHHVRWDKELADSKGKYEKRLEWSKQANLKRWGKTDDTQPAATATDQNPEATTQNPEAITQNSQSQTHPTDNNSQLTSELESYRESDRESCKDE